ncbi:PilW family protein [Solimonas sp. SE-A11]|uniref:PilW family protein n=1 Tax=Solimonas sp. SE-A11 TaxID=3054954 RepID=UPI00259D0EAC|nr:PilW family protein [Solimonas sp. SE-A11]MDM4770837.1 PilW family protein [Solimonas sp. SE-A11]
MSRIRMLPHRPRQRGYSLIEIMISLLIGAVMIGAVLTAVSGTGLSGTRQSGYAQLSEDGQIALNLIASQLRMGGFWEPTSPVSSLHNTQPMLFGCRNGFSSVTAAFGSLACATGTGNDSVAIRYDSTEGGTTGFDCLGAAVPAGATPAGWVDNRFYIATGPSGNPSLFCRGNGGGDPQMLVDNVESLQLRYGIPQPAAAGNSDMLFDRATFAGQTVRYVRADALLTTCPRLSPASNSWCGVTAVRACITMRTALGAGPATGTAFVNCDGTSTTIADSRLRRSMVTTVSLRNRMP